MAIRPIPRTVRFRERDRRTKQEGRVTKEARIFDSYPWGDFVKVLQEIRFEGRPSPFVRLGYYFKPHGSSDAKYRWGSQTGLIIPRAKFLELLRKGRREGIL